MSDLFTLFDGFNAAVTANTDIIGGNGVGPVGVGEAVFRIYVCFLTTAGTLTVRRKKGATTVSELMNKGNNLDVGAAFIFDIPVAVGETIDLRYSQSVTATKVSIRQVSGDV